MVTVLTYSLFCFVFIIYLHFVQVAKAGIIVGDPSYFDASKSRVMGQVVRSICILNHAIAGTDNAESVQIIIPAKQVCTCSYAFIVLK